jgi:hypothetical protein
VLKFHRPATACRDFADARSVAYVLGLKAADVKEDKAAAGDLFVRHVVASASPRLHPTLPCLPSCEKSPPRRSVVRCLIFALSGTDEFFLHRVEDGGVMKAVSLGVILAITATLARAEDMAEMISRYRREPVRRQDRPASHGDR